MNKLITILMCIQLIIAPVAQATEVLLETQVPPAKAVGDAHWETGLGSTGGYDFYVKQIMILATSIVGANIITNCPKGVMMPSIAMYSAGSLTFIASELFAAKAVNEKHKKSMDDLELLEDKMPKEGSEVQKQALENALEDEKKTLEYIENKRNWMIAITAMYTAAMGTAIGEQIYATSAGTASGVASCAGLAAAQAGKCTVGYAACLAAETAICSALAPAGTLAAQGAFANPAPQPLVTAACQPILPYGAACNASANTYLGLAHAQCSPLRLTQSATLNKAISMAIMMAWGLGVGKMEGGKISQWGTMLSGLLMMLVDSTNQLVTAAYSYPIPRSITFGASAALGGIVIAGLVQRQKASEKNIEKLQKVLEKFKVTTETAGGIDTAGDDQGGSRQDVKKQQIKRLAKGITPNAKTCLSSSGGKAEFSNGACRSPVKAQKPNFTLGNNLNTLSTAGMLGSEMANAAASGDVQRASALAGSLGSMAGKIREVTEKLKKNLNDKLKAEGKRTVDFDGEIKKQLTSMEGTFNKAAASQGMGSASLGGAKASLDPAPEADKKEKAVGAEIKNESIAAVPTDPGIDLGIDPPADEGNTPGSAVGGRAQSLDEYEASEADISKARDVSIFNMLSNRYLLNYSKIFERKRPGEPGTSPAGQTE